MGNKEDKNIMIEHFLSHIGAIKTTLPESRTIGPMLRNREVEGEMEV